MFKNGTGRCCAFNIIIYIKIETAKQKQIAMNDLFLVSIQINNIQQNDFIHAGFKSTIFEIDCVRKKKTRNIFKKSKYLVVFLNYLIRWYVMVQALVVPVQQLVRVHSLLDRTITVYYAYLAKIADLFHPTSKI